MLLVLVLIVAVTLTAAYTIAGILDRSATHRRPTPPPPATTRHRHVRPIPAVYDWNADR